ncbi:hypothetical protein NZK35_25295 [Stieleria sp. ICT_E10.1]|uniref:hypothetical protein n=1 Tax=Stieleria sedimenti TaxID=2976331 RepID=UPI0021800B2E|nr:hypothetical protein [Stieleria sedimenti]MCS7469980.1 hypothetical protein [Stieleria sedimenti]
MRLYAQRTFTAAIASACLLCGSIATAKKPDKPGGGGDGDSSAPYRVVQLPFDGLPYAISEVGNAGTVTVAINSTEAGYGSAAFARVEANTGNVLESGFLPEPPTIDPDDGLPGNLGSSASDVNVAGSIVGHAMAYDPTSTGDLNPRRAVYWSDAGAGYACELLALPSGSADSYATAINNWSQIVGSASTGSDQMAVLWDGTTGTVADLNTQATADLGWDLRVAGDINDDGLVIGYGTLNGQFRGFLLDSLTNNIWPVPLVGPATENSAYRINACGCVVGSMWNGSGQGYGTDPDYVVGYFWDPAEPNPQVLPPTNLNTCRANALNDLGATVGASYIPTDDIFGIYSIPTLWEHDAQGGVVTTDLNTQIPDSPGYTLVWTGGINNTGWIGVEGRKRSRGRYSWHALVLIPNN